MRYNGVAWAVHNTDTDPKRMMARALQLHDCKPRTIHLWSLSLGLISLPLLICLCSFVLLALSHAQHFGIKRELLCHLK